MKKKIIILGGGFAGSHVAKRLDKYFSVTLIDTKNYFEFTPGVLRTIVEPSHIKKIQVLHNHYLKWARIIIGKVDGIRKDFVSIGKQKIEFDYLVIASGSNYNAPFKEQRVVFSMRAEHLKDCYNVLCRARRVLIIGGGLVGVELAGEILDKYDNKEIIIVHSNDRLIERNSRKASDYAENYLKSRGVKILFEERMIDKKGCFCIMQSGKKVRADLVFLCTGIKQNYYFVDKKYLGERGIKVNNHLQLIGKKNIFACGDVSDINEEKTAQNAERQADVVYHNICNLEKGKKLCEYKSKITPLVISLGKNKGIFSKRDFVMTGFVPALMKSWIEKWEMYKKRRIW
ncbi:FAD-dependent oxidoreductase [Candidatus Pacearchaeota archaeon]|nr:FAD-dependent oxidoreductase [Candidatus Pacearchaeota archaeon]